MRTDSRLRLGVLVLAICGSVLLCGCQSGFQVPVTLADNLRNASVQVQIIGIDDLAVPKWSSINMTDYWAPGSPMMPDRQKIKILDFDPGKVQTLTLSKNDPVWRTWSDREITHLVVLANIPGAFPSREGNADARRLIIDLRHAWYESGPSSYAFTVSAQGITYTSAK